MIEYWNWNGRSKKLWYLLHSDLTNLDETFMPFPSTRFHVKDEAENWTGKKRINLVQFWTKIETIELIFIKVLHETMNIMLNAFCLFCLTSFNYSFNIFNCCSIIFFTVNSILVFKLFWPIIEAGWMKKVEQITNETNGITLKLKDRENFSYKLWTCFTSM